VKLRPRWLARALAWIGGWFWLACPRCGEKFAGFEIGGVVFPHANSTQGWSTCSDCPGEYRGRPPMWEKVSA
jgi:hypothetical protein